MSVGISGSELSVSLEGKASQMWRLACDLLFRPFIRIYQMLSDTGAGGLQEHLPTVSALCCSLIRAFTVDTSNNVLA